MNLYVFDIGERARKVSRFIGHVRAELRRALATEKASRKLSQQQIATMIGTSRSVINREIMGLENLTLRRVAELAWALGWEIVFELRKPEALAAAPTIQLPVSHAPRSANLQVNTQALQVNPQAVRIINKSFAMAA
jgi:predicted XRE-type DNA-binding protein